MQVGAYFAHPNEDRPEVSPAALIYAALVVDNKVQNTRGKETGDAHFLFGGPCPLLSMEEWEDGFSIVLVHHGTNESRVPGGTLRVFSPVCPRL